MASMYELMIFGILFLVSVTLVKGQCHPNDIDCDNKNTDPPIVEPGEDPKMTCSPLVCDNFCCDITAKTCRKEGFKCRDEHTCQNGKCMLGGAMAIAPGSIVVLLVSLTVIFGFSYGTLNVILSEIYPHMM